MFIYLKANELVSMFNMSTYRSYVSDQSQTGPLLKTRTRHRGPRQRRPRPRTLPAWTKCVLKYSFY